MQSDGMACTWDGCGRADADADVQPMVSANKKDVWACLCSEHREKLFACITQGPRLMVGAWVRAQGGARAAADRMRGQRV